MIITVTLNAALDRILTVPNFQLGHRHRASEGVALAGGKGINIARALKRLDVPVVATGLAGGRTGARILEELSGEGILHDFVLISDESQTSTAVVDPSGSSYTEIYERGPEVAARELDLLLEKLHYLARAADWVVFAGSLPRKVDEGFYADAIRDLNRRGARTALDAEGEPLRLGVEAEPFLVSPNEREAEALVGQEFHEEADFAQALDDIAELGARNVLIAEDSGCFALFREERERRRFHVVAPKLEVVSPVGSADVLLAGFIAAEAAGRPLEEALRSAVAAGAASTLAVGAGRFEPREAGRLLPAVEAVELAPAEVS
jgi:1-phosphofructokinase/tagatose 6-phosphate kinase